MSSGVPRCHLPHSSSTHESDLRTGATTEWRTVVDVTVRIGSSSACWAWLSAQHWTAVSALQERWTKLDGHRFDTSEDGGSLVRRGRHVTLSPLHACTQARIIILCFLARLVRRRRASPKILRADYQYQRPIDRFGHRNFAGHPHRLINTRHQQCDLCCLNTRFFNHQTGMYSKRHLLFRRAVLL